MIILDYKKTKLGRFFLGKGFYGVLALCLAAVGAAAWSAFDRTADPESIKKPEGSQYISSSERSSDTEVKAETESKIPYASEDVSSSTPSAPIVATSFTSPMAGGTVKPYSENELIYSATFSDLRTHLGLDIEGSAQEDVRACGNGFVSAIIDDPLLGKYVEIDHGKGVVARYCGLETVYVEEGEEVSATTCIGLLGIVPGECQDAPHLHLEFYCDEYPVDPMQYIGQ